MQTYFDLERVHAQPGSPYYSGGVEMLRSGLFNALAEKVDGSQAYLNDPTTYPPIAPTANYPWTDHRPLNSKILSGLIRALMNQEAYTVEQVDFIVPEFSPAVYRRVSLRDLDRAYAPLRYAGVRNHPYEETNVLVPVVGTNRAAYIRTVYPDADEENAQPIVGYRELCGTIPNLFLHIHPFTHSSVFARAAQPDLIVVRALEVLRTASGKPATVEVIDALRALYRRGFVLTTVEKNKSLRVYEPPVFSCQTAEWRDTDEYGYVDHYSQSTKEKMCFYSTFLDERETDHPERNLMAATYMKLVARNEIMIDDSRVSFVPGGYYVTPFRKKEPARELRIKSPDSLTLEQNRDNALAWLSENSLEEAYAPSTPEELEAGRASYGYAAFRVMLPCTERFSLTLVFRDNQVFREFGVRYP